jgi:MYXO-CTERM domain-containing protein
MTQKAILAGVQQGLSVSTDRACSWRFAVTDPVVDVVVRRDDSRSALAITSKFAGVGDAGENLHDTHVLATHDDGATWATQGVAIDPEVQVETIDVAPGDSSRIYVGGARTRIGADGGPERVGVVLVSHNGGASYGEGTIPLLAPFEPSRGAAFVSAVDPTNADRVYVRIGDLIADRLLVSDDGAATFRTVFQGRGPLLGFALSSDGPRDGVHLAAAGAADSGAGPSFAQQSTAAVSCLTWVNGALYACMGEPQNTYLQQLGLSTDDGASFAPRFYFGCLPGPLVCPGCGVDTACSPGLALLRASLGVCDGGIPTPPACVVDSDAGGASDAGVPPLLDAEAPVDSGTAAPADAGSPPPPPSNKSCGCGSASGESAGAGALAATAFVAAFVLRRRRSRVRALSSGRASSRR